MSDKKVVIDLGQCDPDHASIRSVLESLGVRVERAHSFDQAKGIIAKGGVRLVLVNRVLDHDGSDGVSLIPELIECGKTDELRVILVSNYPEAQAKAESLGARPGFGKAELRSPATVALLRAAL